MDMLGDSPALQLGDDRWRIYSRHDARAPHYVAAGAVVENSSITEGCEIRGTVRGSVLGAGVKVMAGIGDRFRCDERCYRKGGSIDLVFDNRLPCRNRRGRRGGRSRKHGRRDNRGRLGCPGPRRREGRTRRHALRQLSGSVLEQKKL